MEGICNKRIYVSIFSLFFAFRVVISLRFLVSSWASLSGRALAPTTWSDHIFNFLGAPPRGASLDFFTRHLCGSDKVSGGVHTTRGESDKLSGGVYTTRGEKGSENTPWRCSILPLGSLNFSTSQLFCFQILLSPVSTTPTRQLRRKLTICCLIWTIQLLDSST